MKHFRFLFFSLILGLTSNSSYAHSHLVEQFCKELEVKKCSSNLLMLKDKMVVREGRGSASLYIDFPRKLNFKEAAKFLEQVEISSSQKREALQSFAINLNKQSVNNYIKKLKNDGKTLPISIQFVAVNNSAVFEFETANAIGARQKDLVAEHDILYKGQIAFKHVSQQRDRPVVALIDSGVSLVNSSMRDFDVFQFYPKTKGLDLVDTGLGHGTGIISLVDGFISQNDLESPIFLSCVGLPHGKYVFIDTLECMNWLFLQPRVDIILNPWLASSPGCLTEWNYALQMIWLSNSIPVFSAGNYGEKSEQSYSPANLSPFWPIAETVSVGATSINQKRLASSSYQSIDCERKRPIATINALGSGYSVAVPFTENSFQQVEGTSYAIVPVAIELLQLKKSFPDFSNAELVSTLFSRYLKTSNPMKTDSD